MVLALETSTSSSRTRRTSSRISALVCRISLSAFAVAARDAFLRRLSAFSGAWVQQSPCDPLAGSVQRSPFRFVALHWLICDLPFLDQVGGRSRTQEHAKRPLPFAKGVDAPHQLERSDGSHQTTPAPSLEMAIMGYLCIMR